MRVSWWLLARRAQLAFLAVTTDTLLGVATPCTVSVVVAAAGDATPPQAAIEDNETRANAKVAQRSSASMSNSFKKGGNDGRSGPPRACDARTPASHRLIGRAPPI
jgi:hypothetical protein